MTLQQLQTALAQTRDSLAADWPEIIEYLPEQSDKGKTTGAYQSSDKQTIELADISQEERRQLLDELRAVTALPPGQFDRTTAQELATRLRYLLHRSVSFSIGEQQLTYAHGSIRALPPSERISQPIWPANPALSQERGLTASARQWEVTVTPRDLTPLLGANWQRPWFLYQSVLLINPIAMQAVAGQVTGILTDRLNRYQFGASPALMQAGAFWSPGVRGRGIVCFSGEAIANGTVINLTNLTKN